MASPGWERHARARCRIGPAGDARRGSANATSIGRSSAPRFDLHVKIRSPIIYPALRSADRISLLRSRKMYNFQGKQGLRARLMWAGCVDTGGEKIMSLR